MADLRRNNDCDHGFKLSVRPCEDEGPDWVERFAPDCGTCGGTTYGVPYKVEPVAAAVVAIAQVGDALRRDPIPEPLRPTRDAVKRLHRLFTKSPEPATMFWLGMTIEAARDLFRVLEASGAGKLPDGPVLGTPT